MNKTPEQLAEEIYPSLGGDGVGMKAEKRLLRAAFISGWKVKKGLQWVRASERKPERWKDVIVRSLLTGTIAFTQNMGNFNGWDVDMDYRFKWDNTEWLDESEPNPDDIKQTAMAFAEYTREAPGSMWQRAHGPLLSTEELYDEFKKRKI